MELRPQVRTDLAFSIQPELSRLSRLVHGAGKHF
jgi:hypothetical protein